MNPAAPGVTVWCVRRIVPVLIALAPGLLAAPAVAATPTTFVGVSVATLWTSPRAPRTIDRPALADPPDLRAWSQALTVAARRGLVGRIETQALLGERVRVLARRGGWLRVVVPGQPTPRDRRGYPGWVPSAQVVTSPAFGRLAAGRNARVLRPTAWLQAGARRLELSYGTRLPLLRVNPTDIVVALPGGGRGRLPRAAVALTAPPRTTAAVVADARRFLGVRYLWGGRSAFGFDCSGLLQLSYAVHGVTLPRDADAQARVGRTVSLAALKPGDLVFYGRAHVHHVTLYVGDGRMLEAPNSSSVVRIVPLARADVAGARRVIPASTSDKLVEKRWPAPLTR